MTWIALRRVKLRGTWYQKGDVVADGARLNNRRQLVTAGYIVEVPDDTVAASAPRPTAQPEPEPEPMGDDAEPDATEDAPNLGAMKRADLNAYGAEIGLDDPEGYPNREALIDAIEDLMADDDDGGTA